jgi:hypothetical protein
MPVTILRKKKKIWSFKNFVEQLSCKIAEYLIVEELFFTPIAIGALFHGENTTPTPSTEPDVENEFF